MEDKDILELYNSRSEDAIQQTADKYGNYCMHIAFNILSDREDSEECVSDAYLRVWEAIPPAQPKSLKAFLGKVVRNRALDISSRNFAQKRGGSQVALCLDELSECVPAREVKDGDAIQIINEYLAGQRSSKVKMFMRRYWYMDSVRDVAISCNCSESKVKTTLLRMRRELQQKLSEEGIEI